MPIEGVNSKSDEGLLTRPRDHSRGPSGVGEDPREKAQKLIIAHGLILAFQKAVKMELPGIQTVEDLGRLHADWSHVKNRVENLIGRPLKLKEEAPADQEVIDIVKEQLPSVMFVQTVADVIETVFREESVDNVSRVAILGIAEEISGYLFDRFLDNVKVWLFLSQGLVKDNKNEIQRRQKIKKADAKWLINEATGKSTPISKALAKACSKAGIKLSDGKLRIIARKILKRIDDPKLLLPGFLKQVAKKLAGTPVLVLRLAFTPTRISENSDDVLSHVAKDIDDAFKEASAGIVQSLPPPKITDLLQIKSLPEGNDGPTLRQN